MICQEYRRKSTKEALIPSLVPDRKWQKVASDIFRLEFEYYNVLIDYYLEYFKVSQLRDTKSKRMIEWQEEQMARHGILAGDGYRWSKLLYLYGVSGFF